MPRPKSNLEEQLLTAAAELIATDGLEALSLRELGRRAGVSRAAPYHYFSDKAELIARVGESGFSRLKERIAAAASTTKHPLKQLRAGLLAYIEFARAETDFFHLMFSRDLVRHPAGTGPPFSSDAARAAFEQLVEGIRAAQTQRLLRRTDPLLLVHIFWAYTHGIAVLARDGHLKYDGGAEAVFEAGFEALVAKYRPAAGAR